MNRRTFLGLAATSAAAMALAGCTASSDQPRTSGPDPLPAASPDPESPFGVDAHINMDTIDAYLERDDVALRDMRLLSDPADYAALGGNADLDITIEGFKIVPFPYIATLAELPVDGAYAGETLFDVVREGDEIAEATPAYEQSLQIIEELFPRDKALLLICGGGGYAGMMRKLLIHLGWEESRVYKVGGAWDYAGYRALQLISYDEAGEPSYYHWRADYAMIDFPTLTRS